MLLTMQPKPIRKLSLTSDGAYYAVGEQSVFVPMAMERDSDGRKTGVRLDLTTAQYGYPSKTPPVDTPISSEDQEALERFFEVERAEFKVRHNLDYIIA